MAFEETTLTLEATGHWDSYVASAQEDTNFSAVATLYLRYDDDKGEAAIYFPVFHLDVSSLGARDAVEIMAAQLEVYVMELFEGQNYDDCHGSIWRITEVMVEGQVCWHYRLGTTVWDAYPEGPTIDYPDSDEVSYPPATSAWWIATGLRPHVADAIAVRSAILRMSLQRCEIYGSQDNGFRFYSGDSVSNKPKVVVQHRPRKAQVFC